MARRTDFGADWSEIIANWYLGLRPSIDPDVGWEALGTLDELWPGYLDEVLALNAKGSAVMAKVVDLGMMLKVCRNSPGFGGVFARLKNEEKGALSEVATAAWLIGMSYQLEFEPWLEGRRLDLVVHSQAGDVYFEVTAPNESDAMKQLTCQSLALSNRLVDENPGVSVDVYPLVDPSSEVAELICAFVRQLPPVAAETVHEIPRIARIRRRVFASTVRPFDLAQNDSTFPIHNTTTASSIALATIWYAYTDHRVQRLVDREARHFSEKRANVLVVDVSQISGIRGWVPLLTRRLQPELNRRVGAIIVYEKWCTGQGMVCRRHALRNPFAYRQVPQAFLDGIAAASDPAESADS